MEGTKEEYKDLIVPELSYDAELKQLNTAIVRFELDNKNLLDFLEKKNIKDPEIKILAERYKDDFEMNFVSEAGYDRNLATLKRIEDRAIGSMPIINITERQLEAFMKSML